MKNYFLPVTLAGVLFVAPRGADNATLQPYSPASKAPVQAEQTPTPAQTAPSASPYTKQGTQPAPQPAAPVQKLSPAVPLTKQPSQPGAAVAERKIELAKLVSVQPGQVQLISWGYLRAYEPQTLERMLGDVNAGRLPRAAISGVVHPAQLDTLLKNTRQPAGGAADSRRLPTGAITKQSPAQAAKTPPSTGVGFVSALRSLPLRTTPDRLEFGTMMLGQVQSKTVRFVAPQNGEVRASIADPAFRIRRLRSLNGTLSTQTVPVALATGATIQSVNAVANASQQRTAPPWTIQVRSGEDVEVTIDLSRSPSVTLGEHTSPLQIDLTNSLGAIVPVHARLDGRLYGIGIDVDGDFGVFPGSDFMLPFEWVNDGEPSEATLTLDNPLPGFTTPTPVQTIKLGKGERRQGAFVINVSNALRKLNNDFATLNLKVANGPIRMTYEIRVIIYPPWYKVSVNAQSRFDDGDQVRLSGMMQIRTDGWFQFDGYITSSGAGGIEGTVFVPSKIYRYVVGISLPGGFSYTGSGSFGRSTDIGEIGKPQTRWIESGMSAPLAANFIAAARGLGYAASNPYVKVTKSFF